MSNIAILPTLAARAAAHSALASPRNASTCGLFEIAGRLGQANRSARYLCRMIDALIESRGFPSPYPLLHKGSLETRARNNSRWPRAAVDAWFFGQLPPDARAAVGDAERVEVDSRLNANLAHLFEGAA